VGLELGKSEARYRIQQSECFELNYFCDAADVPVES
jgi:hypothetical protein